MSSIVPIETRYRGYRFRSRLEARWAVFYDAARIPWEYEPEGYVVEGEPYLPDFRTRIGGRTVVHEVKPEGLDARIKSPAVYLAGKMTVDEDWRGEMSPLSRHIRRGADEMDWGAAQYSMRMAGAEFLLTGPFPSSCDHGCAHSLHSLHMAESCDQDINRPDIVRACKRSIAASDLVCAHLSTADAFGTLVEIGLAANISLSRYL